MKKVLALVLALMMVFSLSVTAFGDGKAPEEYSGTLTIYSPHDSDPLNDGVAQFEAAYPNVKVEVVADGTSNLVAKIAAESASPVADVLWGGGADTLAAYKEYFQPYCPSSIDLIDPSLYDAEYYWIGESPLPMVFIANTNLVPEDQIPTTWEALADWDVDTYGKIAIADPTSSGSAFTQICTILFLYGEEAEGVLRQEQRFELFRLQRVVAENHIAAPRFGQCRKARQRRVTEAQRVIQQIKPRTKKLYGIRQKHMPLT